MKSWVNIFFLFVSFFYIYIYIQIHSIYQICLCSQCCFLIVHNRQTMQNRTNTSDWRVCECTKEIVYKRSRAKMKKHRKGNMHVKHLTFPLNLYSISECVYFRYVLCAHMRERDKHYRIKKSDEWKIHIYSILCWTDEKRHRMQRIYNHNVQIQKKKIKRKEKEWKERRRRRLTDEEKKNKQIKIRI